MIYIAESMSYFGQPTIAWWTRYKFFYFCNVVTQGSCDRVALFNYNGDYTVSKTRIQHPNALENKQINEFFRILFGCGIRELKFLIMANWVMGVGNRFVSKNGDDNQIITNEKVWNLSRMNGWRCCVKPVATFHDWLRILYKVTAEQDVFVIDRLDCKMANTSKCGNESIIRH